MSRVPLKTPAILRSVEIRGARRLVTIPPEHPIWNGSAWVFAPGEYQDAYIRLRPPENFALSDGLELIEALTHAGAVSCKVDRAPCSRVVPEERAQELRAHGQSRDAVLRIARDANVPDEDKPVLVLFLENVMAQAKL